MRSLLVPFAACLALSAGCSLQDSTTPVPQADTLLFGRVVSVPQAQQAPGGVEIEIRAGLPESLQSVMRDDGRFIPELEKDLVARVKVSPETICIAGMLPVDLDAFRAGQEVAVVPVPGTSTLTGTKLLHLEAAELYDFKAYEVRYLGRALETLPAEVTGRTDPARINSSGLERAPLPLDGGRVVYFAAGLLPAPPGSREDAPRGAVREGMKASAGLAAWTVRGWRPYRVAWSEKGWGRPAPVSFPGLDEAASAVITWVNEEETECLVEVAAAGSPAGLHASRRAERRAAWAPLTPVEVAAAGGVAGDAQRFGASRTAMVWTVYDGGSSNLWLRLSGEEAQALEPRINTLGAEWAPRLGPNTTLYFCRGDRQLLFAGGIVDAVRLPGAQRRPLLEAAPTSDGSLLFFRVPRYTPGELDWDIAVAPREGERWGAAVRLDEFRFEGQKTER